MGQAQYFFNSANVEPKWQVEATHTEVSCIFDFDMIGDFDPSDGHKCIVQAYKAGSLIIALTESGPYERYAGSSSYTLHAASPYYFLELVLEGCSEVFLPDGTTLHIEGSALEIGSIDKQKRALRSKNKTLYVFLPKNEFAGLESRIEALVAGGGGDVLPPLLAEYLRSIVSVLPRATDEEMDRIGETTKSILRASFVYAQMGSKSKVDGAMLSRLDSIKADIRRNFLSPSVDLAELERRLNISRRKLHKIFEPEGGVASFIRSERLEIAWKEILLSRGRRPVHSIAEDLGFSDPSVFSRLFKAKYGHSPGTIRCLASDSPQISPSVLDSMF